MARDKTQAAPANGGGSSATNGAGAAGAGKKDIPKTYRPHEAAERWYRHWVERGYFTPKGDGSKPPFTIVIPPPNVTGNLHLGHALNNTLQDILIRFKRMQGYDALWLPGMDHAGIATQTRVEAKLAEEGLTRHDLGREAFLERVWSWKEHFADVIRKQWASLGLSLDYSRERFTLDEGLSRAVREVFVRLYEKGLIYRGEYIIHWDPVARTALSDIEVEYREVEGKLYHLRYPLKDESGWIEIATTRPETMFGDVAVAVHPDDERYRELVGKTVVLPVIGREIPIIADAYVDPTFGTGAVKVTPAHDPNDFEIGLRHDLPRIVVMDESGRMNENAGPYAGLDRFECRRRLAEDLAAAGVLVKAERHVHNVGHSQRTGAVVEPYLSTQWFVRMKPLAERAIAQAHADDRLLADRDRVAPAAEDDGGTGGSAAGNAGAFAPGAPTHGRSGSGENVPVRFVPERFKKIYLNWIENVRDWVISRQLWWGHRIPAWHCDDCGGITVDRKTPPRCVHCGSERIRQDEDVLDTWFSSALWPFSTLGWPEETDDFRRFYPTDVLVTGHDIIFFWVARMIFTALEFTGNNPFRTVLIHGLVRDAEGRKMSKSLGNGVDPMEMIEKYGADALRFMLSTGFAPGQDLRFREDRMEAARNFANKVWNASRFVLLNVDDAVFDAEGIVEAAHRAGTLKMTERWILSRLAATIEAVTERLERFEIGEAGRLVYDFIWDEYCDWFIEFSKEDLYGADPTARRQALGVLLYVLERALKLLHPYMPFVTEEIYHLLPAAPEGRPESLVIADWPRPAAHHRDPEAEEVIGEVRELIRGVRNIRQEVGVAPGKTVALHIAADPEAIERFSAHRPYIARLAQADVTVAPRERGEAPETVYALGGVTRHAEYRLPLRDLVDVEKELERLKKEWARWDGEVERVRKKLADPDFVEKAPPAVVEAEREKERDYLERREKVRERLELFTRMLNDEHKAQSREKRG
ncbi:valine--tRNA ligase [Hydrogenibacillus schlegelii]|nr:valine--tRNA ligase [Hydrogenibacillus schlegelii]